MGGDMVGSNIGIRQVDIGLGVQYGQGKKYGDTRLGRGIPGRPAGSAG